MDSHVKWLRRRVIQSVGTQSAVTFAGAALVVFAMAKWVLGAGVISAILASIVGGQLVVIGRIAHALRSNEFSYTSVRQQIDRPFGYRVSRFQGHEATHPNARQLPGFSPIAIVRDDKAEPASVIDICHDPSGLVVAAVDRSSGMVTLLSSIDGGRTLVSTTRRTLPHERLVVNAADGSGVPALIATHQRAIVGRSDIVQLKTSPHQVVVEWLATTHRATAVLGPVLTAFFDPEPAGASRSRLVARIETDQIGQLPVTLGPDHIGVGRSPEKPLVDLTAATSATGRTQPPTAVRPIVQPKIVRPQIADIDIAAVPMSAADVVSMPLTTASSTTVVATDPAGPASVPARLADDLASTRRDPKPPATLREAMMPAPDTAAALTDPGLAETAEEPFAGYAQPTPLRGPRLSEVLRAVPSSSDESE